MSRRLWIDVLRSCVVDAFVEQKVEIRRFGRLHGAVVGRLRNTPTLNLLLGAAERDILGDVHLEEALEWMESLNLDFRVPVSPGGPRSLDAEWMLRERGYTAATEIARYVLEGEPASLSLPPNVEVMELDKATEGFSELLADGYELDNLLSACFFDGLPGRNPWRCYFACDARGRPFAAAAAMFHFEVAQLAFAATSKKMRGRGYHRALVQRCIEDARERGCPTVFADVEEPFHSYGQTAPAARNLLRFGFERIETSPVWRRPLFEQGFEEDDDWDDEEWGGGDDWGGGGGGGGDWGGGGGDDDGPNPRGPAGGPGGAELPRVNDLDASPALPAAAPGSGRLLLPGAGPAVRSG